MASRVLVFNPRSSQELLHTLQVARGCGGRAGGGLLPRGRVHSGQHEQLTLVLHLLCGCPP